MDMLGVNQAGAEFGSVGQAYNVQYTYPTKAEIDYDAAKGLNVIRLPILWERIQPKLNGGLDPAERGRLDAVVTYATSKSIRVDIDIHNYGKFNGQLVGSASVPDSAFANLWGQLAKHYASNPKVIFGLMNEPQQTDASAWLSSVNAAIAAVRSARAPMEILISGINWDGASTWVGSANADVIAPGIVDPLHNYAFEVHQYLDSDASGTHSEVVSTSIGVDRLTSITQWAEQTGNRLFLGEFAVAKDATSLSALSNMLTYMNAHTGAWQGATEWAAGPWWRNYMYSIEPVNGVDAPQMAVLEQFEAHSTPTAPTATAPTVASQTANQTWTPNEAVIFSLAANTFADPHHESLTYSATLASGAPLPSWLQFNSKTGAFTGKVPDSAAGLSLRVTATNASGLFAVETFAVTFSAQRN